MIDIFLNYEGYLQLDPYRNEAQPSLGMLSLILLLDPIVSKSVTVSFLLYGFDQGSATGFRSGPLSIRLRLPIRPSILSSSPQNLSTYPHHGTNPLV